MMIENSTPMNENAFGSYGEFVDTPEMSAEEWAQHDAEVAAEIEQFAQEQDDMYWEMYGEMQMAQWDVPDLDLY